MASIHIQDGAVEDLSYESFRSVTIDKGHWQSYGMALLTLIVPKLCPNGTIVLKDFHSAFAKSHPSTEGVDVALEYFKRHDVPLTLTKIRNDWMITKQK